MSLLKRISKPWLWTAAAILTMTVLSPFLLSGMIRLSVAELVFETDELPESEPYDVILVFGCGIKKNGAPSDMLEDRLKRGIALYEAGMASKLLLSGDHEFDDYNEIAVMKQYCLDAGVPEEVILCDRYGLSTYDSVVRARMVYGIQRAVLVTQTYHLYRALYIADKVGMEAIGVDADIRTYRLQWYRELREVLARCKDFYMTQWETSPQYPMGQ